MAAAAIAHGLPLFTSNPRDFDGIPELQVHPVTRGGVTVVGEPDPAGS